MQAKSLHLSYIIFLCLSQRSLRFSLLKVLSRRRKRHSSRAPQPCVCESVGSYLHLLLLFAAALFVSMCGDSGQFVLPAVEYHACAPVFTDFVAVGFAFIAFYILPPRRGATSVFAKVEVRRHNCIISPCNLSAAAVLPLPSCLQNSPLQPACRTDFRADTP